MAGRVRRASGRLSALTLIFAVMTAWTSETARASTNDIAGPWLTAGGDSIVRFDPCGTGWCGQIARVILRKPGAATTDAQNPDPTLRTRPIEAARLFALDRIDGSAWRGTVYDPRSGRTYQAMVRRSGPGQLEVKGCFAVFCQVQHWTAAK